eukprot:1161233-Pelagomonas_calceolata.AAC.8
MLAAATDDHGSLHKGLVNLVAVHYGADAHRHTHTLPHTSLHTHFDLYLCVSAAAAAMAACMRGLCIWPQRTMDHTSCEMWTGSSAWKFREAWRATGPSTSTLGCTGTRAQSKVAGKKVTRMKFRGAWHVQRGNSTPPLSCARTHTKQSHRKK